MKKKVIGIVKKAATATKSKSRASRGKTKIAILSWNSLRPAKGLKLATKFKANGAELPIEATRIAKSNGKLVLVIDEGHGAANKVFFAQSAHGNLDAAAKEFVKAEKIGASRVGIIDIKNQVQSECVGRFPKSAKAIFNWAKNAKFDAVIFSGLGRRFKDSIGENFSVERAGQYIAGLSGKKQKMVIDHLKNVDKNITTPFLQNFRASLKGSKRK